MVQQKMYLALILGLVGLVAPAAQAATTWHISSSVDDGISTTDTTTLRGALAHAAGGDTIYFDALSSSITAWTAFNVNHQVCIQGNGNTIGAFGSGSQNVFSITAAGTTITGLAIVSGNYGIYQSASANGCIIQNCCIGIDWQDIVRANYEGVEVYSSNNLIGGYNADASHFAGNVISGNSDSGIIINGGSGNSICGNIIGLNRAGTAARGNINYGIFASSGSGQFIGGGAPGYRNIISGNAACEIESNSPNTIITGNYIGLSRDGMSVLASASGSPVSIVIAANGCRIGGSMAGEGNFIVGYDYGIRLASTPGNIVVGNYLGVLADFTIAPVPLRYGISLNGSDSNQIGVEAAGMGNLIAGTNYLAIENNGQNNSWYANTICAFTGQGIYLVGGTNNNKAAPIITFAGFPLVSGTSGSGDHIQIFLSDRGAGMAGGSLQLLGTAIAVGTSWTCILTCLPFSEYICAIATDTQGNSSPFSMNHLMALRPTPTNTPTTTPTVSPTSTPSSTITPTPTISPTTMISPTITLTYTISTTSTTYTISPTSTITPTSTATLNFNFSSEGIRIYPNPGQTQIHFAFRVSGTSALKVAIYNLAGEKAAELSSTSSQELVWDCQSVAPGVYLARISVNGKVVKIEKIAVIH